VPIKPPEIVAAVDLGSNSFHMIVCSLNDGKLQTIDRLKEMVRLASGLDANNVLNESTQIERWLAWKDLAKNPQLPPWQCAHCGHQYPAYR